LLANVSLSEPRLDLWDLNRKEVVQKFKGHKQELNIIKTSFGGVSENVVMSGSEDSFIYIWNKEKGEILARLEGHTQGVNAVHWNPADPYIFASASDD